MATDRPVPPFHPLQRDALFADARRRAQRGRRAALRLAWARLGRLVRQGAPAGPATPPLPQRQTC